MAGDIPITRNIASPEKAEAIRAAVRSATRLGDSRLARPEDAPALFALLSDPAVHAPIYTLPRPLTEASVAVFIETHIAERETGIGLLFVREGEDGRIMGYSDVQVWPHWAAGELGGALHPRCTVRAAARAARRRALPGCSKRCSWTCCARRRRWTMSQPSACSTASASGASAK